MSAQSETNETSDDQDIKRWTAKRRAALVIESLCGHQRQHQGQLYDRHPLPNINAWAIKSLQLGAQEAHLALAVCLHTISRQETPKVARRCSPAVQDTLVALAALPFVKNLEGNKMYLDNRPDLSPFITHLTRNIINIDDHIRNRSAKENLISILKEHKIILGGCGA